MLTKINQREEDKYYVIPLICGILKKKKKSINYLQNRNTVTDGKKNKLMVTGR